MPRSLPVVVPLVLLFLGATLIPRSFRPLDDLGIPYPHVLRFTHFIVAATTFLALLSLRRHPLAAFVIVVIAMLAITSMSNWPRSRVAAIPVTGLIDGREFEAWQGRLGFKVCQHAGGRNDGGRGPEMWVDRTPGRAEKVAEHVKRIGIARP